MKQGFPIWGEVVVPTKLNKCTSTSKTEEGKIDAKQHLHSFGPTTIRVQLGPTAIKGAAWPYYNP